MKSKTKAIALSAVTIGCCTAIIAGASIAAFTSSEQYDFLVQSGEIKITTDLALESMTYVNEVGSQSATILDNETGDSNATANAITLDNALGNAAVTATEEADAVASVQMMLAQGVSANFKLSVKNESSVGMKYIAYLVAETGAEAFLIDGNAQSGSNTSLTGDADSDWVTMTATGQQEISFSIGLGWDPELSASGSFTLIVRAVQSNAAVSIMDSNGNFFTTLADAMQNAEDGAVIDLAETQDPLEWPSQEEIEALGEKQLTIRGAGQDQTTLVPAEGEDAFYVPENAVISDMTLDGDVKFAGSVNASNVTFNGSISIGSQISGFSLMSLSFEEGAAVFDDVTFKGGVTVTNADVTIQNSTMDVTLSSGDAAINVEGGSMTLDGNDFTMTGGTALIYGANNAQIKILSGNYASANVVLYLYEGSGTISDGTFTSQGGNMIQLGDHGDVIDDLGGGSLVVDGGTFRASMYGFVLFGESSLVYNGGDSEIYAHCISGNNQSANTINIDINGGSIESMGLGAVVYLPGNANLTITDGTLTGGVVLDMRMGTAKITGGTLSATENSSVPTLETTGKGAFTDGSAIMLNLNRYVDNETNTAGVFNFTISPDVNVSALHGLPIHVYDWNQNTDDQEVSLNLGGYEDIRDQVAYYEYVDGTVVRQAAVLLEGVPYASLVDAVAAVPADNMQVTIKFIATSETANGSGVKVQANQNFVIDFNGVTYIVTDPTVGSTGTETNGFQLLKGSTVVMKNGTVKPGTANCKIMFQKYNNLTLENMVLDARDVSYVQYVISNNCGDLLVTGKTQILASANWYAFDLYYWPSNGYGEGVNVTFDAGFMGKVEGKIGYGSDGTDANWLKEKKAVLKVEEGCEGTFEIASENSIVEEASIEIAGGTFTSKVMEDYLAEGYELTGEEGAWKVVKE